MTDCLNLRKSQNRDREKEGGEKQQEEELQLPKTNQTVDVIEGNCDNAEERIESTKSLSKKTSTDPISEQEDSPEKAMKGMKIFCSQKVLKSFFAIYYTVDFYIFFLFDIT